MDTAKNRDFVTYSSESEIRRPVQLFKAMLRDLWKSKGLAFILMKRDITASYRQSLFGVFWAFIPSVATAITFSVASRNKILNISATDIPYPAYVLFSVALWQIFSESVMGPIGGLAAARSFITKIKFEYEALFIAKFGEVLVNVGVKALLITATFFFYGIMPSPKMFFALFLIVTLILLGQSIGLLLAPINVIYADIGKAIPIALGFGMFVTPVVYPMPTGDSLIAQVVNVNPLTYLIISIRELSIYGTLTYSLEVAVICFSSLVLFLFSWMVFRLSMPYVIER
jgi:lipopolysaccharide transport system permease protein